MSWPARESRTASRVSPLARRVPAGLPPRPGPSGARRPVRALREQLLQNPEFQLLLPRSAGGPQDDGVVTGCAGLEEALHQRGLAHACAAADDRQRGPARPGGPQQAQQLLGLRGPCVAAGLCAVLSGMVPNSSGLISAKYVPASPAGSGYCRVGCGPRRRDEAASQRHSGKHHKRHIAGSLGTDQEAADQRSNDPAEAAETCAPGDASRTGRSRVEVGDEPVHQHLGTEAAHTGESNGDQQHRRAGSSRVRRTRATAAITNVVDTTALGTEPVREP